jgi:hypothetical protein
VFAEKWPVAVAVQAVRLTLVAEHTGHGGEALLGAADILALEGLQMRVDVLAVREEYVRSRIRELVCVKGTTRTRSCT